MSPPVGAGAPQRPDPAPTPWQVHAYIISSLKKEMPNVFGKESKKKELVNNLGEIYQKIEREHQISPGDFPSLRKMQVRVPWVAAPRTPGSPSVTPGRVPHWVLCSPPLPRSNCRHRTSASSRP